jgi:uncharacterized protein
MKITLIGGTGYTGTAILGELVSRAHTVTTIVRRHAATLPTDVNVVEVDILNTEALTAILDGADTVVSAYNPGWQKLISTSGLCGVPDLSKRPVA